jgi:hypothetical protein
VSGQHERIGDAVLAAQEAYAQTGAFPELLSIYPWVIGSTPVGSGHRGAYRR